jgi:hypothetical protein
VIILGEVVKYASLEDISSKIEINKS